MQHPDEILTNVRLENETKHLEHTLETYVYRHYNTCNISIYFCNIKMKHLKHYILLQHGFCLDEWRHAGAEVDDGAWTSLCGSGTGNSPVGAVSNKSCAAHLLAGASIVDARWRRSRRAGWPRRGGSTVEAGEAD